MSAISFKTLTQDDVTTSRTLLHESIPITGTLVSGTYETSSVTSRGLNVKTFSHGMFQSVYDYPYASSSANHIFDLTVGCSTGSYSASGSIEALNKESAAQVSKKVNMYNQMAQILVGYDTNGNIRRFDRDGDYGTTTDKMDDMVFMNFSRLLVKDEIKKGSFELKLGTNPAWEKGQSQELVTITDASATTSYRANSPAGEYGFLKKSGVNNDVAATATVTISAFGNLATTGDKIVFHTTDGTAITASVAASTTATDTNIVTFVAAGNNNTTAANLASCLNANSKITATANNAVVTITQAPGFTGNGAITLTDAGSAGMTKTDFTGGITATIGLIYYQAGIVALTASAVGTAAARPGETVDVQLMPGDGASVAAGTSITLLRSGSMDSFSDGVRNRIHNIKFNNTTELNSTIYFCRANKGEFNYSSNPTYLTGSKIRVKEDPGTNEYKNMPMSYVTTVGLYSPDNELLAVAKLSEPVKKTPINELNLRVRLDY